MYHHVLVVWEASARIYHASRIKRHKTYGHTNYIDLSGFYSLKSQCVVVLVVSWAEESCPNGTVLNKRARSQNPSAAASKNAWGS